MHEPSSALDVLDAAIRGEIASEKLPRPAHSGLKHPIRDKLGAVLLTKSADLPQPLAERVAVRLAVAVLVDAGEVAFLVSAVGLLLPPGDVGEVARDDLPDILHDSRIGAAEAHGAVLLERAVADQIAEEPAQFRPLRLFFAVLRQAQSRRQDVTGLQLV